MLNRVFIVLVFIFIYKPSMLSSQNRMEEKSTAQDMSVNIEFEKTMFNYGQSINLQLVVLNKNYKEYFLLAPQVFINYVLEVYKTQGESVSERDLFFSQRYEIMEKLKSNKNDDPLKIGFERIKLKKNAILGVKIDLNQIYDLKPGRYLLRLKFYPSSMLYNPLKFVYSPFVQIIVKDISGKQKEQEKIQREWVAKQSNIKTPEQTVQAFFEGKIGSQWDEFFYVINLRELIKVFKEFNDAYAIAKDEDKNAILEDFKTYLVDSNSNEKILSWEIEETVIKKNQAILKIVVKALVKGMEINREYHFRLEKKDHWYITEYGVIGRN